MSENNTQQYIACLLCKTDYNLKFDINNKDSINKTETGYCPRCEFICRNCEKVKMTNIEKGLCEVCDKLWKMELDPLTDDDSSAEKDDESGSDDDEGDENGDGISNDDIHQTIDDGNDDDDDVRTIATKIVNRLVLQVVEDVSNAQSTNINDNEVLDELEQEYENALTDNEDDLMSVHSRSVVAPEEGLVAKTKQSHGVEVSRQLLGEYQKSHGRVGSDGSGGSTNGELAAAGCKVLCAAMELNNEDVLCDIGSGGGLAIMQMTAEASNACSIGIEVETMRHIIATNFNARLMEKRPDKNYPVAFLHADILSFSSLNGFSKVYMYDPVFPPTLLLHIGKVFNQTTSIQYIACTQNLLEFGFNVELHKHVGCLSARGGKMSHSFSVYKSKHFAPSSALTVDARLVEMFSVARHKEMRLRLAKAFMSNFHSSKMIPRSAHSSLVFGENIKSTTTPSSLAHSDKAEELFYLLKNNKDGLTLNGITYISKTKTNAYERYTERHLKSFKIECAGVAKAHVKKALIAPSYSGDSNGKGKLLLGLIYDPIKSNGHYSGVVYDLFHEDFRHKVPLDELYYMFDYTSAIPCSLEDIMKKYRKHYPLDTARNTELPDKRLVTPITPGVDDVVDVRVRPSTRSKRKRTVDDRTREADGEELDPVSSAPPKQKRGTPIEDKLRANLKKQDEMIADLKRKLEESAEHIRNMEAKPNKQSKEDTKVVIDEAIQKAASKYLSSGTKQVEVKLSQLSIKNAELSAQVKAYQESFEHIKTQQDRLDSMQKTHEQREEELLKAQREAEKKTAEMDTKYQVASKEAEMYKLQQKREDERYEKEQTAREKETTKLYALIKDVVVANK